jgi:hypothetical protein
VGRYLSIPFFVSFQVIGTYLMVNLFTALVIEAYEVTNAHESGALPLTLDDVRSFARQWYTYAERCAWYQRGLFTPSHSQWLRSDKLLTVFSCTDGPMGVAPILMALRYPQTIADPHWVPQEADADDSKQVTLHPWQLFRFLQVLHIPIFVDQNDAQPRMLSGCARLLARLTTGDQSLETGFSPTHLKQLSDENWYALFSVHQNASGRAYSVMGRMFGLQSLIWSYSPTAIALGRKRRRQRIGHVRQQVDNLALKGVITLDTPTTSTQQEPEAATAVPDHPPEPVPSAGGSLRGVSRTESIRRYEEVASALGSGTFYVHYFQTMMALTYHAFKWKHSADYRQNVIDFITGTISLIYFDIFFWGSLFF